MFARCAESVAGFGCRRFSTRALDSRDGLPNRLGRRVAEQHLVSKLAIEVREADPAEVQPGRYRFLACLAVVHGSGPFGDVAEPVETAVEGFERCVDSVQCVAESVDDNPGRFD